MKINKKHIFNILITIIILIAIIILFISGILFIDLLQHIIFVPESYLMYKFKSPYCYLIFMFEFEIICFAFGRMPFYSNCNSKKLYRNIIQFSKRYKPFFFIANVLLIYICLMGVMVITENKIVDYTFYNPKGKEYTYEDIYDVDVGFKGKLLGIFPKNSGEFYYIININNGPKVNLYQSTSEYDDTYKELEVFDEKLMKYKTVKNSSTDNIQYCDLDKHYVERFKRIIRNK